MWNSKLTAFLFLLIFCAKFAVAHQTVGTWFFGDEFVLVKTHCQNKEPSASGETAEENPLGTATTCSAQHVMVLFFYEPQKNMIDLLEQLDRPDYFFQPENALAVFLERQLPPPKLA